MATHSNKMTLAEKTPQNTVLLTSEQHEKVKLNVKVNLTWFNIDGTFVGPYIDPLDLEYVK